MTRDPRSDPRPGDVLNLWGMMLRVTSVGPDGVSYEKITPQERLSKDQWFRLFDTATVITKGED